MARRIASFEDHETADDFIRFYAESLTQTDPDKWPDLEWILETKGGGILMNILGPLSQWVELMRYRGQFGQRIADEIVTLTAERAAADSATYAAERAAAVADDDPETPPLGRTELSKLTETELRDLWQKYGYTLWKFGEREGADTEKELDIINEILKERGLIEEEDCDFDDYLHGGCPDYYYIDEAGNDIRDKWLGKGDDSRPDAPGAEWDQNCTFLLGELERIGAGFGDLEDEDDDDGDYPEGFWADDDEDDGDLWEDDPDEAREYVGDEEEDDA